MVNKITFLCAIYSYIVQTILLITSVYEHLKKTIISLETFRNIQVYLFRRHNCLTKLPFYTPFILIFQQRFSLLLHFMNHPHTSVSHLPACFAFIIHRCITYLIFSLLLHLMSHLYLHYLSIFSILLLIISHLYICISQLHVSYKYFPVYFMHQ